MNNQRTIIELEAQISVSEAIKKHCMESKKEGRKADF